MSWNCTCARQLLILFVFTTIVPSIWAPPAPSFGGMRDAVRQARAPRGGLSDSVAALGDGTALEGMDREAYVTLVATPDYLVGAEVISKCLLHSGTSRPLLALVGDMLTPEHIQRLRDAEFHVLRVPPVVVAPTDPEYARPLLNATLLKLHVFGLHRYVDRLVYLDADILPLEPLDSLFSLELTDSSSPFAAAPEIMPPDKFNTGVLVVVPDDAVYERLLQYAATVPSNSDQPVLNGFFSSWFTLPAAHRLAFEYNVLQTVASYYEPAWTLLRKRMKALHFGGPRSAKPWSFEGSLSHSLAVYLYLWQSIARAPRGADLAPLFDVLSITDAAEINALFQRRES